MRSFRDFLLCCAVACVVAQTVQARNPVRVVVSHDAFARNVKQLKRLAGGKELIATPKSGYGLDLGIIAKWFVSEGIATIALDDVGQAITVRKALGTDSRTKLLALKGVFNKEEAEEAIENRITPVVAYPINLEVIRSLPSHQRKQLDLHLFVNTGINDQGFRPNQALRIAKELKANLKGTLAHFSTSEGGRADESAKELAMFNQFVQRLRGQGIEPEMVHMANSLGIPLVQSADHTAIRVGKGLWTRLASLGTQDAIRFETYVRALVDGTFFPGEKVGYGTGAPVPNQGLEQGLGLGASGRIGILAAGYDFGIPTHLKTVLTGGRYVPVSETRMGHTSIYPPSGIEVGDPVVVYGELGQSIVNVAKQTGKSVSELLTDLRRVANFIEYKRN